MSQASFVVLQRDNHALTRENNALHLEMIRIQEELEDKARGMHLQEKELQHKIEELQFLNTQKTSQLQKKDADLSKLYAQVHRLQGEMQHPTNGGNSTSADAIELNKLLPPAIDRKSAGTSSAAPLSSIDDHDASSKQLDALGRENKALQDRLASLESQVRTRDAEIDRLGKQLKDSVSTKDYATIKAKYDLEAYQIAQDLDKDQLTRQVDLLNDQVAKYEQKLVDALPSQQRLESLTQELKHAQGLNDKYMEQLQLLQQRLQRIEQEHELCDAKQSELTMASDQAEKLVQKLQQQLDDTTLQVTRLENALKATHYDKMSSANSVANLEAHVKVLTTELNQLKPKHAAVCQQLADESSNGKHWTKQRQALETELAALQSKLSDALAAHQTALDGQNTLRVECTSLEQVVADRDRVVRTLQTNLDSATLECQAVARQLHQQSLANESQRSIDVQAQHASVHSEERVMLRRDNDALQVRVRRLELLRNELDVALRDAQAQGTSWKHQVDHLQDQMTETLHDLAKANAQLNQVKMEVVHLQQDKTQLETQVADARREIEKLSHVAPHEATAKLQESKWQKRVTEAELSKQLVETQLSAAVAAKAGLEQRLAQAETKLRSADDRAIEVNAQVSSLQSELANVQSELASTKQSKLYFETEYEAAMLAWTDQSKTFQTAQHDLDAADGAQRESARQIHDLQAALTASQTKCHQVENLLGQAQSHRKTLEMQWTLVQEELRHAKDHQLARESTIKRLQTETSELSRRVVQLEQDNGQLKHLVGEMECGRDKWSLEHKQLKMDMNDLRESNGHLEGVREQLEASIGQLKQSLSQVRSMLEASDRDKDALIHMLDVKTEEMSALDAQSTRVSEQQSAVRNELVSCQASLRQLEAALADKEATVTTLQANLDKADKMSARLKEDVELGRGEHVALTQDLHHMTIENQSLAGECAQLHHEIDQMSGDIRSLHQHVRQVERERDGCMIELNDLKQTYRTLVVEMDALEGTHRQLNSTRTELGNANAALRHQLQDVVRERDAAAQQVTDLDMQVQVNLTQIKQLTQQLQQLQDKQLSTVRSHEMLSGALSSQHAVATELAQDRVESAATNSSLNQRLASLQAQLHNSVHDRTELTNQVAQLGLDKQRLEALLASVRSQVATLQMQSTQHQEDKAALVHALNQGVAFSPATTSQRLSTSSRGSNTSRRNAGTSPATSAGSQTMQEAEERCRSLEARLSRQDATIQQLEQSRSKFRKFAAKYEVELEQRDQTIEALRSSSRTSSPHHHDDESKTDDNAR